MASAELQRADAAVSTAECAREPFQSSHGGAELPAWGRAHAGDVRRQKTKQLRAASQLKQLPSMRIEWFDAAREHNKLKLGDEAAWQRKRAIRELQAVAVAASGRAAAAADANMALSPGAATLPQPTLGPVAEAAAGPASAGPQPAASHNVVPAWILDVWDGIAFLPCKPPHVDFIHPEQLIVWGAEKDTLTSLKRMQAHIRKRVREDLLQPPVAAAPASAAAKA
jgi:hypothetical protein